MRLYLPFSTVLFPLETLAFLSWLAEWVCLAWGSDQVIDVVPNPLLTMPSLVTKDST